MLCACGCGQPASNRYVRGHNRRGERTPIELRLLEKIELDQGGCWLWTGYVDHNGYGTIRTAGEAQEMRKAHRVAYEALVDLVPADKHVDHLCRVRHCVNPEHLEVVAPAENNARSLSVSSLNAKKTHCHKGHPFDADNTYLIPGGGRSCKQCSREWHRKFSERKRLQKLFGDAGLDAETEMNAKLVIERVNGGEK